MPQDVSFEELDGTGSATLHFIDAGAAIYTVESSQDLVDWTPVLSVPSQGRGVRRELAFKERSGSTCFYRLAVTLPASPNP